ncbi:MAG: RNA 2',3'-cyclic phosphodiesterase [Gemmataceae bacterium]
MSRRMMRTFIAVPLDDAVRRRAVALQGQLGQGGASVKWVEPENLHVTLLFLGEVDARATLDVCRAVQAVTSAVPPFPLEFSVLGGFPNLRRPRTLWIGIGEGMAELVSLHDALENALLELGCYRREDRAFTPHLTLGRTKTDDVNDAMRTTLNKHATWQGGQQLVREIQVLSSEFSGDTPVYTILSRCPLEGNAT